MIERRLGFALAVGLLLVGSDAAGDAPETPADPVHIETPAHVVTDGGTDLQLPPGYYLSEPAWSKLDTEVKRLQDAETRLTAQNKSLRSSVSGWQPGWYTCAIAAITGAVVAVYLERKI